MILVAQIPLQEKVAELEARIMKLEDAINRGRIIRTRTQTHKLSLSFGRGWREMLNDFERLIRSMRDEHPE